MEYVDELVEAVMATRLREAKSHDEGKTDDDKKEEDTKTDTVDVC